MKAETKGHLINLGITVVGTFIGAYLVHRFIFMPEQKALATSQKQAALPPRKVEVTTILPEDQSIPVV